MTVINSLKNTSLYFIVGSALLLSSSPIANPHQSIHSISGFAYAAKSKKDDKDSENEGLIEDHQCMDRYRPDVIAAANGAETTQGCEANECGGGCCRYYTYFLTCDTDNSYPHQPCVCNDITNNTHIEEDKSGGDENDGGDGIDVGQNSTSSTNNTDVDDSGTDNTSSTECTDGNVWWNTLDATNPSYTTCSSSSACANVTMAGGITYEKTCCLKQFCWCGNYQDEEHDCL